MESKILRYGIDTRDHLVSFQRGFYAKRAPEAIQDDKMAPETLGKNWSCCLLEREGKRFLAFFDGDDGSGGTPSDCKLVWSRFQNLVDHYGVADYLVLKVQFAPTSEQRQFYPFKRDVYPLALMTNDPERVFRLADEARPVEQDIDVLFVGGRVHDRNYPYCWPKWRDTNQHWPTNRRIGYDRLLEIKGRRTDLNVVALDGLAPPGEYYGLINRSKICLDFPGIGLSSRKFYEFLVLGKCVLALPQNLCCWPLEEWKHYAPLYNNHTGRPDFGYEQLEGKIDQLLERADLRSSIGANAAALRPLMSFDAVGDYAERTIEAFVDRCLDGTIQDHRSRYE